MAERFTPEERAAVKRLLWTIYARSGARTWAEFARQAKVSESSLAEWRSDERGLPDAVNLLRLLASVGVVREDFSLPTPSETPAPDQWEQARSAAVRLANEAEQLARLLAAEA